MHAAFQLYKKIKSSDQCDPFQIASHLVWDVVGEEGEVGRKVLVLVLVDANQKVLGVVLMMVVLEELEAEVGVAKVESPEEAEVNHKCIHCFTTSICILFYLKLCFCYDTKD
jgi:hypothetical protein